MKRLIATLLLTVLTVQSTLFALDGDKAAYFGGTATAFAGAKDPVEGTLDTSRPDALVLTAADKPYKGMALTIPYASVIDIEYGQKAGRRVGAAVATTALLGPIGLVTLFSKKRKHFLTIGYKDAQGMDQVAVLELGKDIVRTTLPILEKRTGKAMEYQDDEARKASKG